MKKVNFREIIIEDIRGEKVKADLHEVLGNQLYMQGADIKECELGRKIFFAECEVELSDEELRTVSNAVQQWRYIAKTAVLKALDQ
jgi:hypothetical protein